MSYYIPGNILGGAGKMKKHPVLHLYYLYLYLCYICVIPFPVLANMSFWYNGVGNLVKSFSSQLLILAPYCCRTN